MSTCSCPVCKGGPTQYTAEVVHKHPTPRPSGFNLPAVKGCEACALVAESKNVGVPSLLVRSDRHGGVSL